ncbi:MAG: hypothetical protein KBS59_06890, partial [Clostridiales bacterium]|nr:hypothetical protein [Clostridiales bacterium]
MMNNDEFRKDVYERFETHKKKKAERQKNLIKYGSFALCIAIMISAVPVIRGLSLAQGKSN